MIRSMEEQKIGFVFKDLSSEPFFVDADELEDVLTCNSPMFPYENSDLIPIEDLGRLILHGSGEVNPLRVIFDVIRKGQDLMILQESFLLLRRFSHCIDLLTAEDYYEEISAACNILEVKVTKDLSVYDEFRLVVFSRNLLNIFLALIGIVTYGKILRGDTGNVAIKCVFGLIKTFGGVATIRKRLRDWFALISGE